jgi:hypothetical protein
MKWEGEHGERGVGTGRGEQEGGGLRGSEPQTLDLFRCRRVVAAAGRRAAIASPVLCKA